MRRDGQHFGAGAKLPAFMLMITTALTTVFAGGCSIRGMAVRALADSFSGSGGSFASDDDPDLVRDASPFALKTMEQLLDAEPRHVGLLTALARNFTQYGYAFVQQDADRVSDENVEKGRLLERRARRLYLRGREYGLRGLDVRHEGMRAALLGTDAARRDQALAAAKKEDVELLYWTGASWALAISAGKDDMALVGQLPTVEAVMARALALDETFDEGAIHEFYVSLDGSRGAAEGGGPEKARQHLARARQLSSNKKLGSLVSYAETVLVSAQDRKEFVRLLEEVASYDTDKDPPHRLANLVAQRRARWLLARQNELFAD